MSDHTSGAAVTLPYIGVDGCAGGWLCVALGDGGEWRVRLLADNEPLGELARHARLMLIDMPIGLPGSNSSGQRQCDVAARRLLGRPRASSVFPVPSRATMSATSYSEALLLNRQHTGRGISKQAWNIVPKIVQIDRLLQARPELKTCLRECHPEVCFWALNGQRAMAFNKKTSEGRDERLHILMSLLPQTQNIFEHAMQNYRRRTVASDDVIDAMVVALTARLGHNRLHLLPEKPPSDDTGLSMEIVYATTPGRLE